MTVTGVRMSPDLRHAKIFISSLGSDSETDASLETLNHASGWIRRQLGQRIRMKFLPEIAFLKDTSQQYGERIDTLIDKIHEP